MSRLLILLAIAFICGTLAVWAAEEDTTVGDFTDTGVGCTVGCSQERKEDTK